MVYLNIEGTLCYKMQAPFLIDNSVDMTLENFNYIETNKVKDYLNLNTSRSRLEKSI